MAIDIKTATLEDYRDMMLRPTKLNETAQVLYDLAQQSDGSLIEIGTSKKEIEALQNRMKNAENDISYLKGIVSSLTANIDTLSNTVNTLTENITIIEASINNLNERVTALENA